MSGIGRDNGDTIVSSLFILYSTAGNHSCFNICVNIFPHHSTLVGVLQTPFPPAPKNGNNINGQMTGFVFLTFVFLQRYKVASNVEYYLVYVVT